MKMGVKSTFFFIALVASSLALPVEDGEFADSPFFVHADLSARIVGGTEAVEARDPHMVMLHTGVYIRSLLCGGSIITLRTVLTAAHCIRAVTQAFLGPLNPSLRGTAGANRLDRGGAGGLTFAFDRYVSHENYNHDTIKEDIGILITRWNIPLSERVQILPLNYEFIGGNVPVRAAGFGRIVAGGAISQVLLELEMNTIDGQTCQTEVIRVAEEVGYVGVPPVDPLIEICTFHSPGHGMCNGDSGSALTRRDTGHQVGLVSWGIPCARGGPDMFVRVSAYQAWLAQHVV